MSGTSTRKSISRNIGWLIFYIAIGFTPYSPAQIELEGFCADLPRPAYSAFEKHQTSNEWFEVYEVEPNIWAIYEPFQWQEVISYLIVGTDSALLFDTGNGLGDIRAIVDQLTKKPVTVLNSHSHFDHIGGNHQFDNIASVSTTFAIENSRGAQSEMVSTEASPEALCKALPAGVTQDSHQIKAYKITRKVSEGEVIDLGNRKLEILQIPGHTDDSIALLDAEAGLLWTGDSFYEGPIWLYFPETDLTAYKKSIARLAALAPQLNAIFPAHNTPKANPALLVDAQRAFNLVLEGKAEPVPTRKGVVTFDFDGFGFLMREDSTLQAARPGSGGEIQSVAGSGDEALRTLYEREYAWRQAQRGKIQDDTGKWVAGEQLPRVDANTQSQQLAYWDAVLAELDAIPVESLSDEEQINAAVLRQIVQSLAEDTRFKTYEAPLNSDTYFWVISHPRLGGFKDADAYRRYFSRLEDVPRYFSEQIDNMRAGLKRGYSVPAVTLAGREESIEAYLSAGRGNPYWTPISQMPASITVENRQALEQSAEQVINTVVLPAYRELLTFMQVEYLPATRQTIAASDLPDGAAFYQSQIRNHTTLDLRPEDIHQQGLNEVARIRQQMELTRQRTGFKGDMAAFIKFLRSDPQFYAKTPEELMVYSAYVAKRMDGKLDEILGFLPRQRFTILPVPDAIAPYYTAGRGGLESCLMNTYDLPSRPLYTLAALTLHECSPGHALQAAIALEAPGDIPKFREDNYFSGYGEGWGLYTEWLGAQMGIYRTPYEDFGRLSYEMWRAARLVIDTGLHHYGWSREQAQEYLSSNTALSVHEVTTEVDRYISWPGQALAYKLGEMLIRRKRLEAEEALGAGFDQRYFHDTILGLRSVPLPVLESELDRWIAMGGLNPYE